LIYIVRTSPSNSFDGESPQHLLCLPQAAPLPL
jgi:hypothetical protein